MLNNKKTAEAMNQEDIKFVCLREIRPFLLDANEFATLESGGPLFSATTMDSLALVNLVVALEKSFSIDIDAENLDEVFSTLSTLVAYIQKKLQP